MRFRPCIDLHGGRVKQIVGSTLSDERPEALTTNFIADQPPAWFADLFRRDALRGGHVIMLGPGNEDAAAEVLAAWPGGFQVGGGITAENGRAWLDRGASHVIVTSWVFRAGRIDYQRLRQLVDAVGRERLVLDLSCRYRDGAYRIAADRWQTLTDVAVSAATMAELARYCDEFLIHAADVEGRCAGVETGLVALLGEHAPLPTTYAGGIRGVGDLELVDELGRGRIDATIGSGLDIFGGTTAAYRDVVAFHRRQEASDGRR